MSVTKLKKHRVGRPRIHDDNAARQRAYRKRRAKRIKANLSAYWDHVLTPPAERYRKEKRRRAKAGKQ